MFSLDAPITVRTRVSPTHSREITRKDFSVILTDIADRKLATAVLAPCTKRIVLWTGADYDAAGDYTQAQAEARLREILGTNPAAVLSEDLPLAPSPSPLP